MHGTRRTSSLLVAVVAIALTATSCSSSSSDASDVPLAGGTLIDLQNFAGGDPDHLDPALAADVQSSQVAALVYDGLTKVNEAGDAENAVAENVSVSSDATVWTFRLRDDVTFSNGEPVLPSDFKFAWQRVFDPKLGSTLSSQFSIIEGAQQAKATGELSGVTANDVDRTLVVSLERPYRDFLAQVSLPVYSPLPKRVFDATPGLSSIWEETPMIGNGPFKMKAPWERGKQVSLIRNDTYYGGPHDQKAYLNEIEFRISKDIDSAYTDFEAGTADIGRIPAGQYKDATSRHGADVVNTALMGTEYWAFNMNDPMVGGDANKLLRQAISHAIDKDDIVDKVYNGARQPANGWAPPSTPGYEPRKDTDFSPDEARRLLVTWGKPAPSIRVSFNVGAGHEGKAAVIVQNLNAVGIPAVADPLDLDRYRAAVGSGTLQFFRSTWNADFASYDNMLHPLFHSESSEGQNVYGYSSPEFDRLIDQARAEEDDSARAELYRKAEDQLLDDQVVVPLDWTTASLTKSDRVRDLEVRPLGHVAYEKVWLAT